MYLVNTGASWCLMLPDFPPGKTICHLFSTWNKKVFGEIPGTKSIKFIKKTFSSAK
ncbi:hypothetical protein CMK12_04455 [Candidatus Poribacteria bacterium]|nr:hypothetical protein [Candidatus Poribacteria bacterium]